jgi:hypothetical protein
MQMAVASACQCVNVASIFTLLFKLQSSLKAMRGRIALQKRCAQNQPPFGFAKALGVRRVLASLFANNCDKSGEE